MTTNTEGRTMNREQANDWIAQQKGAAPAAAASVPGVEIGRLTAYIPSDRRYYDTLTVTYHRNENVLRVSVVSGGAAGGMDGGSSRSIETSTARFQCAVDAKQLVALIGRAMVSESDLLFKKYGKPTKNFTWKGGAKGLSLKAATVAVNAILAEAV